jgi:putative ATPase
MVIDLALSPKSNTAVVSIDKALKDLEEGKMGKIPNHIINVANFEDKAPYLYPHNYDNHVVKQQYLPDILKDTEYFEGTDTGKYEKALKERYKALKNYFK